MESKIIKTCNHWLCNQTEFKEARGTILNGCFFKGIPRKQRRMTELYLLASKKGLI